jgi:hypothetical protein
MRPLNSGLPEFSNIIVQVGNSRLGWRRSGIQTPGTLLWIPGSREDARPGMTLTSSPRIVRLERQGIS